MFLKIFRNISCVRHKCCARGKTSQHLGNMITPALLPPHCVLVLPAPDKRPRAALIGFGKTSHTMRLQHCWHEHVSQTLTRFATRATFVAETKCALGTKILSSETFLVSAWRATMSPRFVTDGQRRTQCCRYNVSSFCWGLTSCCLNSYLCCTNCSV